MKAGQTFGSSEPEGDLSLAKGGSVGIGNPDLSNYGKAFEKLKKGYLGKRHYHIMTIKV
jgi:hypothetical protein